MMNEPDDSPGDSDATALSGRNVVPSVWIGGWRSGLIAALSGALTLYVLLEVNFSLLSPLKSLALFGTAGLILSFLTVPVHPRWAHLTVSRVADISLAVLSAICCTYLLVYGSELGQRAALYTWQDKLVGGIGLLLVLEATRRSIGWALPALALLFVIYAHESVARELPDWLFPHRGQDWGSLIGQTYLRTEGVFGTALSVMFRYVFLFVLFGAFLQVSGATEYIIALATRLFGRRTGGPAKVSVLASGLMGSLSGSAVANAATTGTFTIPLMRSIGFPPHIAAGIEAAASSGGALVPPVMGAGAYMMLEIINRNPPVRYLEVIQAALIPAILYYLSVYLLVHFYAKRIDAKSPGGPPALPPLSSATREVIGVSPNEASPTTQPRVLSLEGLTFFGALGGLMVFLIVGYSPFRAVTYSLSLVLAMILLNPRTGATRQQRAWAFLAWGVLTSAARYLAPSVSGWADALVWGVAGLLLAGLGSRTWRGMIVGGFRTTATGGVPLIVAAACVGIIIGLVSRTGIGTGVPQAIIPLAGNSLFLALVAIMFCSMILGMGLPSAVSYLLLATIIGPVFADPQLGVPILAAHLFIFYFGMMAMVTPPVALAAYATASIANAGVMRTGLAAFRFSLVGFTLPFMFVYRPELCLMTVDGGAPSVASVTIALAAAVIGITALASAMGGYLFHPLSWWLRLLLFMAAACSLVPDQYYALGLGVSVVDLLGATLLAVVAVISHRARAQTHEPDATAAASNGFISSSS